MAAKVSLQILSTDVSTGAEDKMTVGYINPAILAEQDGGASIIDACARAIIGLSTDTYSDTLLVTTESVNELLAE